jgi:hypothetical protein
MVIEEKDFRLIPVDECGDRFDLEILCTVNKGKETEYQKFKNVAYGISLESALKKISNFRIGNKHSESIDLKTYLQEYRAIIDEVRKLCES